MASRARTRPKQDINVDDMVRLLWEISMIRLGLPPLTKHLLKRLVSALFYDGSALVVYALRRSLHAVLC